MSDTSPHHDSNAKNTSSGQGALGMGGQPTDDPRDEAGGGGGPSMDESSRPAPVPGAFGSPAGAQADAKSKASQAVGPAGDSAAMADVEAAIDRAAPVDPSP